MFSPAGGARPPPPLPSALQRLTSASSQAHEAWLGCDAVTLLRGLHCLSYPPQPRSPLPRGCQPEAAVLVCSIPMFPAQHTAPQPGHIREAGKATGNRHKRHIDTQKPYLAPCACPDSCKVAAPAAASLHCEMDSLQVCVGVHCSRVHAATATLEAVRCNLAGLFELGRRTQRSRQKASAA
jgi:hypothetical protein